MTEPEQSAIERVTSPDGWIEVTVDVVDGVPRYSVAAGGTTYVEPSPIGFEFADQPPFGTGIDRSGPDVDVVGREVTSGTESWTPEWGDFASVAEDYRRLTLELEENSGRSATFECRVFDDGFGFRVELGTGFGEFAIASETTEFAFAGDYTAWWITNEFVNPRFEQEYVASPLSTIPAGNKTTPPNGNPVRRGVHTPLTMRADDGTHLSVHESGLDDYATMSLAAIDDGGGTHFAVELAPLPDGTKVEATAPHRTPWRTFQIAERPGGLVESQLIPLLAPERDDDALPSVDGSPDTDWIRARTYVGIWWLMITQSANWAYKSDGRLREEGIDPARYCHGARTERAKRYLRFASEHDFDSVLVEGWNVGWDTYPGDGTGFLMGPDDSYPDFDVRDVVEYGSRLPDTVELLMHNETGGNVVTYEREIGRDVFGAYDDAEIHSIKNGYVSDPGLGFEGDGSYPTHNHHCQRAVNHHRTVIREAAANRQLLEIHEGIKPTGEERTYPNVCAREVVKAQEYDGFGRSSAITPHHHVVLPFTRMLAGPTSFQPGIFAVTFEDGHPGQIQTTRAKQLAMYPIYLSGLQMAADRIEAYLDETLSVGQFLQASAGDLDGMITADEWRDSFGCHYVPVDIAREPDGASVSFTVTDVPESGIYDLHCRYAADTEANRRAAIDNGGPEATLVVDGERQRLAPDWTGGWDDWQIHTVPVALGAGKTRIAIELAPDDVGGFNLDAVAVSEQGRDSPVPADYEDVDPNRENLETLPEFEFLERVPASWEETHVLDAEIGAYVVTAKRSGEEWFLGAMTDEQARSVEIDLSFLDAREHGWTVTEYTDADGTDYRTDPEAVAVENGRLEAGATRTISIAAGGGTAMWIRPATDDTDASKN